MLYKIYENGDLKNVDIRNKINSLQSSCVKRLNDDCFRKWKINPLYQLNKTFGPPFKFYSHPSFLQTYFNLLGPKSFKIT